MSGKPTFEKHLLESGLLSIDQLKQAHGDALQRKVPLHQSLVEGGAINDEDLAKALASYHQVQFRPGPLPFDNESIALFQTFTLRRFRIFPLEKTATKLTIATSNPANFLATDEVRRITKLAVEVVCVPESAITQALAALSPDATPQVATPPNPPQSNTTTAAPAPAPSSAPSVAREELSGNTAAHIDAILQRSVSRGASDIHFEPQMTFAIVRERIDGVLYEVERLAPEAFAPVLSRLKLLCGMDIVEKRLAQDGRFKYRHANGHCEIRGSTLPCIYGEKMVLRLLRSDKNDPTLEMLDAGADRLDQIKRISSLTDGLVLVAGPTGSGKTTTIYAILATLDRKTQNVIMIEDPVEYELEMANQVQINQKIGVTFESMLPFILRQDPDVLMVGEMRDEGTTHMVMRAAISGHLVFSSIHAPTAIQTIARLIDMGAQPHMVVASLKATISQRLVRRLCPHCKQARPATAEDKRLLGTDVSQELTIYDEVGCDACHRLGFLGRFAVMEILELSEKFRDAIMKREYKKLEEIARADGFKTIREHACERVLIGDTSLTEMLANCPEE